MGVAVATMPHPEAYIGNAGELFDEAGELVNAGTREFLTAFMAAFQTWIEQQRRAA
jgi:chromate reductase